MNLAFDLEEMVEDMFAAYLKAVLPGDMKVYCAFGAESLQYPCAIVSTNDTSPISNSASFDRNQNIPVTVTILVEATPEKDAGNAVGSVRDRNRKVRRAVLTALAQSDLANKVAPYGVEQLGLSMAQYVSSARSADGEKRLMVTVANINVIACPIET